MRASALPIALTLAACSGKEAADAAPGDDDDDVLPPLTTVPPCEWTYSPITEEYPYAQEEVNGTLVMKHLPEGARAVVWGFHGRGGTSAYFLQPHYLKLWNLLGDLGIGIVAVDSVDRTSRMWDKSTRDPQQNEDMVNLAAIREHYVSTGEMRADLPVFAWGFSDGGGYTEYFAGMAQELGWDVRGALVHNSSYARTLELPTFFTGAENDDATAGTVRSYEDQVAEGFESEFYETFEYPFTAEVLLLNPTYDLTSGQLVIDELVQYQYIDEAGVRLADVTQVDGLMNVYEQNSMYPGSAMVTALLRVAWATHRPSGEHSCEERDFVVRNLP